MFLGSEDEEKTETGRPLRKAAVEMKKKIQEIDKTLKNLDEDEEEEDELDANEINENGTTEGRSSKKKDSRPVGALTRPDRPSRIIA